jgi:hypothetical protein
MGLVRALVGALVLGVVHSAGVFAMLGTKGGLCASGTELTSEAACKTAAGELVLASELVENSFYTADYYLSTDWSKVPSGCSVQWSTDWSGFYVYVYAYWNAEPPASAAARADMQPICRTAVAGLGAMGGVCAAGTALEGESACRGADGALVSESLLQASFASGSWPDVPSGCSVQWSGGGSQALAHWNALPAANTTARADMQPVCRAVVIAAQPAQPPALLQPGASLKLSVRAAGLPPLAYRWERVSATTGLALAWSPSLVRSTPELDFVRVLHDDGAAAGGGARFRCVISNGVTSVTSAGVLVRVAGGGAPTWSSEASLRQPIAPVLLAQTSRMVLLSWHAPAWNGVSAGAAPYSVEFRSSDNGIWRTAPDSLKGATTVEMLSEDDTAITSSSGAGTTWSFRVTATNSANVASANTSAALTGVVAAPEAPSITQDLDGVPVSMDPGSPFTLTVAGKGTPVPTYQWLRSGVAIAGQTNATLRIARATESALHDGAYSCRVTNYIGSATSRTVALKLHTLPAVTLFERLPATALAAGAPVVFTCAVSGTPTPSISWHRNGTASAAGVQQGNTWKLLAGAALESRLGDPRDVYQCVVNNSVGVAASVGLRLTVADCAQGAYRNATTGACLPCPIGSYQDASSHRAGACKDCANGQHAAARGTAACTDCPASKFQALVARPSCAACPGGKYSGAPGMALCFSCSPGQYVASKSEGTPAVYGAKACRTCPTGQFESGSGATACQPCGAGRVDGGADKTRCTECPAGQFKAAAGLGACAPCPSSMVSNRLRTACACRVGFFYTEVAAATAAAAAAAAGGNATTTVKVCHACGPGMLCNDTGISFWDVRSKPGYWQVKSWFQTDRERGALTMRKCPALKEQICLGGDDALNSSSTCRRGHTGPMCTTCASGFQMGSDSLCVYCPSQLGLSAGIVAASLASFLLCCALLVYGMMHKRQIVRRFRRQRTGCLLWAGAKLGQGEGAGRKEGGKPAALRKRQLGGSLGLLMKFKILIGLFQVSTQFVGTFDIAWPRRFTEVQDSFSWLNLDLPHLGCMVDLNYADKFLSAVLAPICVLAPFVASAVACSLWFAASGRPRRDGATGELDTVLHTRNLCHKVCLYLLFLVYPATSSSVLKMFHCSTLQNGRSYLAVDMSVECSGAAPVRTQLLGDAHGYSFYRGLAVFFIGVYPIGVPLLFFLVLWCKRDRLHVAAEAGEGGAGAGEGEHALANRDVEEEFGFLYAGYEQRYWWWEVVECFRKVALTGVITFITPGTPAQLFAAVLLAQFFIVAYARQAPYVAHSDDDLQLIAQLQVWFVAISGLAVKLSGGGGGGGGASSDPTGQFESSIFETLMVVAALAPITLALGQIFIKMQKNKRSNRDAGMGFNSPAPRTEPLADQRAREMAMADRKSKRSGRIAKVLV